MLARRIGSLQLADMAAAGVRLEERVEQRQLPRLREALAAGGSREGSQEPLAIRVGLSRGADGLVLVALEVDGTLGLTCQRCLGSLPRSVAFAVTLTAVPDEARAAELPDPFDSVLLDAEGGLDLAAAVEDEILAGLPFAPLHEPGECGVAAANAGAAMEAREVTRPFAALGTLMNRDRGERG